MRRPPRGRRRGSSRTRRARGSRGPCVGRRRRCRNRRGRRPSAPSRFGPRSGPRRSAAGRDPGAAPRPRAQARGTRVPGLEAEGPVEVPHRDVILARAEGGLGLAEKRLRLSRRLLRAEGLGRGAGRGRAGVGVGRAAAGVGVARGVARGVGRRSGRSPSGGAWGSPPSSGPASATGSPGARASGPRPWAREPAGHRRGGRLGDRGGRGLRGCGASGEEAPGEPPQAREDQDAP